MLYPVYNHDTRGREAPEGGVIVNGYSTSIHDISVLCHQQLPLALKLSGQSGHGCLARTVEIYHQCTIMDIYTTKVCSSL